MIVFRMLRVGVKKMKIESRSAYSLKQLNNPTVRAELVNCMKDTGPVFPVSLSVDLDDPAKSFVEMASKHGRENDLNVYHYTFVPDDNDYKQAKHDNAKLCGDIAFRTVIAGHDIGVLNPVAFAVHGGEDIRVDFLFSNVNKFNGQISENVDELFKHAMQ